MSSCIITLDFVLRMHPQVMVTGHDIGHIYQSYLQVVVFISFSQVMVLRSYLKFVTNTRIRSSTVNQYTVELNSNSQGVLIIIYKGP